MGAAATHDEAVTAGSAAPAEVVVAPMAETARPTTGRAVAAFGFLLIAEFFYGWAWNTVDVLRPYIRDSLGLSLTQAGSAYSAQGAGALIGAIIMGQLADRFGRRNMLVVVMIGYGLMLIAGVGVTSYVTLLAQRFGLGLFLGGIFPIVVGIYVGLFSSNVRGRLASMINATFSLSIVLLGLASGALAGRDWHLLLWLGGVPPILLAFAAYMIIPPSADRGVERASKLPIFELFAHGVRRRTVMLASLTGLNFFAYQSYSGWLTIYLTDIRHLPALAIGKLVAWQFSGNIAGGFFWGWAGDRFGRRFNALGFLIAAAAIVVYLSVPTNLATLSVIGCIYGFMLSASVIWGPWITELYPAHLKSTAASIFNWGRIVSFFAPLVTGFLAGSYGLASTMMLASATFAVAGVLWLCLPETHAKPLLPGRRV
ncbi:MFS transporter [Glacieibacterium sp.]|uniref:MFS transporter n=1 Tax=Glacieibacterium sp. TaxID=2860237 RepID=UPI003B001A3B